MEANRRAKPADLLNRKDGPRERSAGFDEKSKRSDSNRDRFASLSDATAESKAWSGSTSNFGVAVRQRLVAASHQATGMQRSLDQSMNYGSRPKPRVSEARRSA